MAVTTAAMLSWTRQILGVGGFPDLTLEAYLHDIPALETLGDLPSGTVVLVRGDLDCEPGEKDGDGDVRLQSMKETLEFGLKHGFKQVLFGHIGRKPKLSLAKVAERLGKILGCEVPLLTGWFDDSTKMINDEVAQRIQAAPPGSLLMLENTRAYEFEKSLWEAKESDLAGLAESLAGIANQFASKVGTTYIHEAFSAGSLDVSSVVVPVAMRRAVLGKYARKEFAGPMQRCLLAQLVVFSGLKADKLDDMEGIIQRNQVKTLFVAGALAMGVKKAAAQLDGKDFCIGLAEDPKFKDLPTYVPPDRLEQARALLQRGRKQGIKFVLPVDFRLSESKTVTELGKTEQQGDVGAQSVARFSQEIGEFIAQFKAGAYGTEAVAFHNGVFGKFEEAPFHEATQAFMGQLRRLKEAGVEVYIGGGEGGKALKKYGRPEDVTHCFTAGGTVLNALGSKPVPFLVALRLANRVA